MKLLTRGTRLNGNVVQKLNEWKNGRVHTVILETLGFVCTQRQRQLCDDASDTVPVENNGVTR